MKSPKITIISIGTNGKVTVKQIPNVLKAMQQEVDGDIEIVPIGQKLRLVLDEEGKCKNKDVNEKATYLYQQWNGTADYIAGRAFIAKLNGEDLDSVSGSTLTNLLALIAHIPT